MKNMRKRTKLPPTMELNESDDDEQETNQHGPMLTIMHNAQMNETFHNKYVKEMQQLYEKMDHDAFVYTFIKMIQSAMQAEENNEYSSTALLFSAKYLSSYDDEETHPVLVSIFKWLLMTVGSTNHITFRICQFINMILSALGNEAALDDILCDKIMGYMLKRLGDKAPNVRVQAILGLQRLQVPDNPDDITVKAYQFHLSADPSPKVRQAVITSIGRNYNTIPYIIERLWDVDEKVRRHTYLHMSSYPVKGYKVAQRLTFLEQGLNDRSDIVKKVVTTVMIPQWFESYNKNIISFVSALKLDSCEADVERFQKITGIAIKEIFKKQNIGDLIEGLPLQTEEEFHNCVPFDQLSIEVGLYWLNLIEFLQDTNADELDLIIPDLSTFCRYVQRYCESSLHAKDKWQKIESQYNILLLTKILYTFDLGDEIGRENLKVLLKNLLKNYNINEKTVQMLVKCTENLITDQVERLQFFVDIINEVTEVNTWRANDFSNDRTLIEGLLEKQADKTLELKLSSLKVKMLDLEEQEINFVEKKDYNEAQRISEERNACREEYANLLKPLLEQESNLTSDVRKSLSTFQQNKALTDETLIKCLQISFYMIVTKNTKSLTPIVCKLYKDFIIRHIESLKIAVRDWALKCGTAYSMLYEQLSKDVYNELYGQFYKNHNTRIWITSIECIFELVDRYGFSHFELSDKQNKHRKPGRQLYNTLEFLEGEDDNSSNAGYGVDLFFMMSHFLDTCDDVGIIAAIVHGFCRLILHGHIRNDDIMEKLLLKYFNPVTEPQVNQLLGVFFENLIRRKKQEYLQPCLIPTVSTILCAPYESPLIEIKPETVIQFVINSTDPKFYNSHTNIHNRIALSFLQEMINNIASRDLIKLLSKEIITLNVSINDETSRNELLTCCDKLLKCDLDMKNKKYIEKFKDILNGTVQATTLNTNLGDGSDEENFDDNSDDDNENVNKKISEVNLRQAEKVCEAQSDKSQEIETNTEEINKDKESTIETKYILSPTTFGKDNNTNLRYLRKSLNVRQRSIDENVPISIENNANSKKRKGDKEENTKNIGSPKKTSKRSDDLDNTIEKSLSSTILSNESEIQSNENDSSSKENTSKSNARKDKTCEEVLSDISLKSISINARITRKSTTITEQSSDNNITEVIPPSQNSKKTKSPSNKTGSKEHININKTKTQSSLEQSGFTQNSRIETERVLRSRKTQSSKRSLAHSLSPKSKISGDVNSGCSPVNKKSRKSVEFTDNLISPKTTKKTDNSKTNSNKSKDDSDKQRRVEQSNKRNTSLRRIESVSAGPKIRSKKHNISLELPTRTTRSGVMKNILFNTIVTRKRLCLDKVSVSEHNSRRQSSPTKAVSKK